MKTSHLSDVLDLAREILDGESSAVRRNAMVYFISFISAQMGKDRDAIFDYVLPRLGKNADENRVKRIRVFTEKDADDGLKTFEAPGERFVELNTERRVVVVVCEGDDFDPDSYVVVQNKTTKAFEAGRLLFDGCLGLYFMLREVDAIPFSSSELLIVGRVEKYCFLDELKGEQVEFRDLVSDDKRGA